MDNKSKFKFGSFETALFAAQQLTFYFASLGFHLTLTASKNSSTVRVSVFYDEGQSLEIPFGFAYSEYKEFDVTGSYWTSFDFIY